MTPPDPTPNPLGGIGLMLEVARFCPRCGRRLSSSPSASASHLAGRGCRPQVFAALPEPMPSAAAADDVPPVPAGRRIRDFETPARSVRPSPSAVVPAAATATGATRSFAIPWLRPPDLGEFR